MIGRLARGVREVRANPFFREAWAGRRLRLRAAALLGVNTVYVFVFLGALAWQGHAAWSDRATLRGEFGYDAWLRIGLVLLSLTAHWLVPPCLLWIARAASELRTLALMVRTGQRPEAAFRGQVAAGLGPLLAGLVPFFAGAPALAQFSDRRGLVAAVAVLGALLWGGLAAGVSLWSGARCRPHSAVGCAYGLLSLALPVLIGVISLAVARGCSAGRTDHAAVFFLSGALTWAILVTGTAAVFWDLTLHHFLPGRRFQLWEALPETASVEG